MIPFRTVNQAIDWLTVTYRRPDELGTWCSVLVLVRRFGVIKPYPHQMIYVDHSIGWTGSEYGD